MMVAILVLMGCIMLYFALMAAIVIYRARCPKCGSISKDLKNIQEEKRAGKTFRSYDIVCGKCGNILAKYDDNKLKRD